MGTAKPEIVETNEHENPDCAERVELHGAYHSFDWGEVFRDFPDGIAMLDAEFVVEYANHRFRELVSFKKGESLATPCAVLLDRITKKALIREGTPIWSDRIRGTVDGRHLEMSIKPRESGWLCLVRDISSDVSQREQLLAIQRAGRELGRLSSDELARMSVAERVDLLKANIIQYAQQTLAFRNLEVRLLDPKTKKLEILLSEGVPGGLARTLVASTEGNGVTGYVAATGKSYIADDVSRDPFYLPGAENARSCLVVPLLDQGQVIGTFNVESDKPGQFTDRDREFLEVFAQEISQALGTLNLLRAEQRLQRTATTEAILARAAVPVDAIVADAVAALDVLTGSTVEGEHTPIKLLTDILNHARTVKQALIAPHKHDAGEMQTPPSPRLVGKRVLVVDAELEIRQLAYRLLAQLGCEVYTVAESREALGIVRSLPYDAIIADAELPELDGYELYLQIHAIRPNLAFVLMKGFGYDAKHTLVRARQAGLRVFLYKPFRIDRLMEALEDALFPGDAPPKVTTRKQVT
jgi:CheY-like chemotaxis protein